MVINEVLLKKLNFTILSVDILTCKGLLLSKTSKYGSNAYKPLSMISSTKLLIPKESLYLNNELEWLLMKFYEENVNLYSLIDKG